MFNSSLERVVGYLYECKKIQLESGLTSETSNRRRFDGDDIFQLTCLMGSIISLLHNIFIEESKNEGYISLDVTEYNQFGDVGRYLFMIFQRDGSIPAYFFITEKLDFFNQILTKPNIYEENHDIIPYESSILLKPTQEEIEKYK
jgi:hypothetical protein